MPTRPQRGFHGRRVLDTHERPIAGSEQKLRVDQSAEKCVTRGRVEPPKAARLRLRESQSRHFEEFTLDSPEHFVGCADWLWRHEPPSVLKDNREGATDMPATFCLDIRRTAEPIAQNRRDLERES